MNKISLNDPKSNPKSEIKKLNKAIINKNHKKVKEYLDSGLKPIQKTNGSPSFLAMAIENNDLKMVELLLDYGANPNERAICNPSLNMTRDALRNYFEVNNTELKDIVEEHAKEDIDILKSTTWNEPVLNVAIRNNNMPIVEKLVENGVVPNIDTEDKFVEDPLVEAVLTKNTLLVKYLLDNGADTNFPGSSVLLEAIKLGDRTMVQDLLQYNAETYIRKEDGSNPVIESLKVKNYDLLHDILHKIGDDLVHVNFEISEIKKNITKLQHFNTNQTSINKRHNTNKQLKIETNNMYSVLDKIVNYKDMLNDGIVFSVNSSYSQEIIISILSIRDMKDYSTLPKNKQNDLLKTEISKLKENNVFDNLNKSKIDLIKNNNTLLLDSQNINSKKRHTPIEILKKSTYVENQNDKEIVLKLLDKLQNYNDPTISTVLTFSALKSLETDENTLNIVAAKSTSSSVDNLLYEFDGIDTTTAGVTDTSTGDILFSSLSRESTSSRLLLHELTHALITKFRDVSTLNDCKTFNSNMKNSVGQLIRLVTKGKYSSKDKGLTYLKNIFDRLDSITAEYSYDTYFNDDVLCDCIGYTQYNNRHKNRNDSLTTKITPMLKFAEKDLFPKIHELIINDKNLDKVILPISLKEKLIKQFPKECADKNITISPLEKSALWNSINKTYKMDIA